MTTPWMPSGMPWWVTHSIDSGASRTSSESRRTVWMPGSTSVPLPVTMRKPMLSPAPSGEECSRRPEITRASLGSATRHMSLKIANRTTRPTMMPPARIRGSIAPPFDAALHGADHDGPRREVLDHDHPGPGRDGVLGLGGVGVEGLGAATDGDHHLADPLGADGAAHPSDLPDHLLVGQPDPRSPVTRRATSRHRYLAASWPSGVKVRGSVGGPATTRSRPASLAAYRSVSAQRTRPSQPSSVPAATPTLVVTTSGSSRGTGVAATARRACSPRGWAPSGEALELLLEVAAVVQAGEGVGAAGQLQLGVAQAQPVLEGPDAHGGVHAGQQLARLARLWRGSTWGAAGGPHRR